MDPQQLTPATASRGAPSLLDAGAPLRRVLLVGALLVGVLLVGALLVGCRPVSVALPPSPPAGAVVESIAWESLPLPSRTGRAPGPPMGLMATDGSPLELRSLTVRAVVEHLLAYTEVEFVVANPHPGYLEGTFTLALPRHAAVGRLAAEVAGHYVEADWVGRLEGACGHAAIVDHEPYELLPADAGGTERRDSVLLEKASATELHLRVFPISGGGARTVLVGYASRLGPDEPFRVPLRGMPAIGALSIDVQERSPNAPTRTVRLGREHLVPDRDFVLPPPELGAGGAGPDATILVNGVDGVAWIRLPPPAADLTGGQAILEPVTLLVDTSASAAHEWERELALVDGVLDVLAGQAGDPVVRVVAFDQELAVGPQGPASRARARTREFLAAREAHGATDLEAALAGLAGLGAATGRLLVVTDGRATLGPGGSAPPGAPLADVRRLDVIAMGPAPERVALAALARRGRRPGSVLFANLEPDAILGALRAGPVAPVTVTARHANFLRAGPTEGLVPGEPVAVEFRLERGELPELLLDGRPVPQRIVRVDSSLVRRLVAQARLDVKEAQPLSMVSGRAAGKFTATMTKASRELRVLSTWSSLLVAGATTYAGPTARPVLVMPSGSVPLAGWVGPPTSCPRLYFQAEPPGDFLVVSALESAPGDASLPPGHERTLAGLARWLEEPEAWLFVAGYASDADRGASPAKLSQARADAVKQALLTRFGVPPERVVAVGVGSRCAGIAPENLREPVARRQGVDFTLFALSPGGPYPPVSACFARSVPARPRTRPPFRQPYPPPLAVAFAQLATHGPVAGYAAGRTFDGPFRDIAGRILMGEALEAAGQFDAALRCYGSLVEVASSAASGLRAAGMRLEHVAERAEAASDAAAAERALALAVRCFTRARELEPELPSSHRLLALALLRAGDHAAAVSVLNDALERGFEGSRFPGAADLLRLDLAWIEADRARGSSGLASGSASGADGVEARLSPPGTRLVLTWEGDGTDVDLILRDAAGAHHGAKVTPASTPELLRADAQEGFGPEELAPVVGRGLLPWRVFVHVHGLDRPGERSADPVMGQVERLEFDTDGRLHVASQPFLVTEAYGWLELAELRPLARRDAAPLLP